LRAARFLSNNTGDVARVTLNVNLARKPVSALPPQEVDCMFVNNSVQPRRRVARRAFTLIELLVVIAIIAILAAILFPVFAKARGKARQAASMSNLKQIALGVIQYTQDYDEMQVSACPVPGDPNVGPNGWYDSGPGVTAGWVFKIQPYIKNIQVFQAPGDTNMTQGWVRDAMSYRPNAYIDGYWDGKYGAMATGGDWTVSGYDAQGNPIYNFSKLITLSDIRRPGDTILLAEVFNQDIIDKCAKWNSGNNCASGNGVYATPPITGVDWMDGWFGPSEAPDGSQTGAWPKGPNGVVTAAHNDQANFAFCDGHVKSMRPAATNPDKWGKPDQNMWDASRK